MSAATTIQEQVAELNFHLDLPHGELPAVTADQFAHGWRLMGPGIPTTNGLSEDALALILSGMLAGLSAAAERDRDREAGDVPDEGRLTDEQAARVDAGPMDLPDVSDELEKMRVARRMGIAPDEARRIMAGRFRPCDQCGGSPAVHNAHPLNAAYVGHEYE